MIRKSTMKDLTGIKSIVENSFGQRSWKGVYQGIENGRYFLYVLDNVPVAMTGILTEGSDYVNGQPEVDWTATHPDFRNTGIMTMLFEEMLKDAPPVLYYSAWRCSADYEHANPEKLLIHFGFTEIKRPRVSFECGINCSYRNRKSCVYYTGEHCYCYEDLWVRNS